MSDDSGVVLLEHYRDQLAEERERKQTLERRGQAVVATNGAIVSLLFAFGTVDVDTGTAVGIVIAVMLAAALTLLVVAAGFGLLANRPEQYAETNVDRLIEIAEAPAMWTGGVETAEAQRGVALDIAKIIDTAQPRNESKALRRAVNLQVWGLGVLAVTLIIDVFIVMPLQGEDVPVPDSSEQSTPAAEAAPAESDTSPMTVAPPPQDGSAPQPLFGDPKLVTKSREQPDVAAAQRVVPLPPEQRTQ